MQDIPRAQRRLVLQGLGAMLLPLPCAVFAEHHATKRRLASFKQPMQKVRIES
ncbi:hypothetical protein ACSFA8_05150 [Variovorax sp. RT4R15]|uniref:hypothetical protein n=1 Tax=Variovorax sp. RT4R15 TaxID=3443737 RepID=UPI003F468ADB